MLPMLEENGSENTRNCGSADSNVPPSPEELAADLTADHAYSRQVQSSSRLISTRLREIAHGWKY